MGYHQPVRSTKLGMIMHSEPPPATDAPSAPRRPRWREPDTLLAIVLVLIGAAAAWYLLLQLAPVLRPLLIAAFLAYVLMPYHARLRHRVGTPASLGILAGSTAGVLVAFAFISYASLLELRDDIPMLQQRGADLFGRVEQVIARARRGWSRVATGARARPASTNGSPRPIGTVLSVSANAVLEACVVALYLLFLLLEGVALPRSHSYGVLAARTRADEILHIAGQVNTAVISYLKAKVKSSLLLAVPVGLILWAVGVKFVGFCGWC